jgi:predicted DNA-binding transcriptional regulator YafY
MNRFDRMLGVLLHLRGGQPVSALDLARRFEVSRRTIYRDVEALSALGVPVYARRGFEGGLQLLDGYFLPPLMFTQGEAVSLLLGLALLHRLSARPFAAEQDSAERKLLAAVPEPLRASLTHASRLVGFETLSRDIFHPEPPSAETAAPPAAAGQVVETFLQAILNRSHVRLDYHSPYRSAPQSFNVLPLGLLWDRDRWYLVGRLAGQRDGQRLWRADRVAALRPGAPAPPPAGFDVRALLDRRWMQPAMNQWIAEAPVTLRLTPAQGALLQQDWYYRHARFQPRPDGGVAFTFGEDNQAVVFALLRWLGPGAELLEPAAWRAAFLSELQAMARTYQAGPAAR